MEFQAYSLRPVTKPCHTGIINSRTVPTGRIGPEHVAQRCANHTGMRNNQQMPAAVLTEQIFKPGCHPGTELLEWLGALWPVPQGVCVKGMIFIRIVRKYLFRRPAFPATKTNFTEALLDA